MKPNDPLYDDVVKFARTQEKISISALQRYFRIGYMQAIHLIEDMQSDNIIGIPDENGQRAVMPEVLR
jgi:DNA segregation ATPase FtsK/SpoIIIE-like protein